MWARDYDFILSDVWTQDFKSNNLYPDFEDSFMDLDKLNRMDIEALGLVESWSLGPFSGNVGIETCTEKWGFA
jgi:hypothetical protein